MVDYIPLSRRRRNTAIATVFALLLGLGAGVAIGRSSAISASEAAHDVRAEGNTLATRLEALTIEYDQAVAGTGDTIQGGVLDALDLIEADVAALVGKSPWLGPQATHTLDDAVADVRSAAEGSVTPEQFSSTATDAAEVVRATFGS